MKPDEAPQITYGFAAAGDIPVVRELLASCGLPDEGVGSAAVHCITAKRNNTLVGVVGLEPRGLFGLARSLAVAPDCRGHSVGKALCARMVNYARFLGIEQLFLLTTTAEQFSRKVGFEPVRREAVPAEIRANAQFHTLCPTTAICMERDIGREVTHASSDLLQLRPDVPGAQMWAVSLRQTMLTYFEVEPNSRFEAHAHGSEQITLVLTGELFFKVAGVEHCVKAGEVIAIPSLVPHAVWTGELPATAVDAWSPVMDKYEQNRGG